MKCLQGSEAKTANKLGKALEKAPALRSNRQRMRMASDDLKHAEVSAFRFTEFGQLALGGKGSLGSAGERVSPVRLFSIW